MVSPGENDLSRPKGRLFRFRLRTLLALPIVFAAAWWWLTWPERSANTFVELLAEGNVAAAQAMIDGPPLSDAFWQIVTSGRFNFTRPSFPTASWREYMHGERQFDFDWEFKNSSRRLGPFVARRNRVSMDPLSNSGIFLVSYRLHHADAKSIASKLVTLYPKDKKHLIKADEPKNYILVGSSERTHSEISALTQLEEDTVRP